MSGLTAEGMEKRIVKSSWQQLESGKENWHFLTVLGLKVPLAFATKKMLNRLVFSHCKINFLKMQKISYVSSHALLLTAFRAGSQQRIHGNNLSLVCTQRSQ